MMPRSGLIVIILALALRVGAAPGTRPNIIFIMTDDHAAHAISAYGSRVNRTPHMDRLGQEGLRLDRCYAVNSICTPSRATILTGQYSHKNGVPVFNPFDGSRPHVAKHLQAAGYHTMVIGKWHLGSDPTGFDHWEILPGQGRYVNPVLYDKDGARVYPGYATDVITDLALAALQRRPAGKPFLLMLHHKAPHREWTPHPKYRELFANRIIPEPPTLYDDYATRSDALREQKQSVFHDLTRNDLKLQPPAELKGPARQQWLSAKPTEVDVEINGASLTLSGDALNRWKYQRYMRDYLACVQSVDDNVGRVMDWVDAHGLRDQTMIVYTSDQGFFLGEHGLYDKRFMYEESSRMPFLVRWPGVIKPATASTALVINCDFAPTFLDLAGQPVPPQMQGRSFVPILKGRKPPDWRTTFYYRYYHDPGHHTTRAHFGVRTETHKLIYFWKKDQWECFDLLRDPWELRNIYDAPDVQPVVSALKTELLRLKQQVQDDDQFAAEFPAGGVDGPPRKWKPGQNPAEGANR